MYISHVQLLKPQLDQISAAEVMVREIEFMIENAFERRKSDPPTSEVNLPSASKRLAKYLIKKIDETSDPNDIKVLFNACETLLHTMLDNPDLQGCPTLVQLHTDLFDTVNQGARHLTAEMHKTYMQNDHSHEKSKKPLEGQVQLASLFQNCNHLPFDADNQNELTKPTWTSTNIHNGETSTRLSEKFYNNLHHYIVQKANSARRQGNMSLYTHERIMSKLARAHRLGHHHSLITITCEYFPGVIEFYDRPTVVRINSLISHALLIIRKNPFSFVTNFGHADLARIK
ncbi:hypothetical protein [Vibrio owensii]|uniref:hypothetical protein n=1 Tax=Vibrio owensii TaxID=696485 RepID=UPI0018F17B5E|nr:hypothetical protein [Vibrio owensii]